MTALAGRVDELLMAPVAAMTFVLAARRGLRPAQLAEPATVTALASTALRTMNPWTGDAAYHRAAALAGVQPLQDLVTAVALDPRNTWWSAPLIRTAQLVLTGQEERQNDPMRLPVPTGPIDRWETYAQKPLRTLVTSTELDVPPDEQIRSGAHATLACGSTDWEPTFPVRLARVDVAPSARIYEVDSPGDWHRLVLKYGDPATHPGSDRQLRESAGVDNGMAPTWSAVATDYDGVHLTFTGLLTALYVPVTTGDVSTTLWAWEWECTCWLRSAFTSSTPLPDLSEPPRE
jgi:hypothetical protein